MSVHAPTSAVPSAQQAPCVLCEWALQRSSEVALKFTRGNSFLQVNLIV